MSPEEIRQYDDPLMDRLGRNDKKDKTAGASAEKVQSGSRKPAIAIGIIGLVAVIATVGYLLYDARQNLNRLGDSLTRSQTQLSSVTQQLETSQGQINSLEQSVSQSQQELGSQSQELARYKTLYRDLKTSQSEQSQELEAIAIRKADQAAVDALADQASGLQGQVGEINDRVGQINTNISDLREQTTSNRTDIDQTRASVEDVRKLTLANGQEIAAVKNSLERDFYSFELQKNGSVIKVFEVALSLKDTDFGKQRFHVEIVAGEQRIRKKGQAINEPIFFYVPGKEKPYELVVNRVDKKFVTGHLSVPKS